MDDKKMPEEQIDENGYWISGTKKEHGILLNYHRTIAFWELNLEDRLDISNLIDGKSESKVVYNSNKLRIDWQYRKRSGEHKKDSGCMKFIDLNSGRTSAFIEVHKGYALALRIYSENFAKDIDNYKDMPLYDFIKSTLYYPKEK